MLIIYHYIALAYEPKKSIFAQKTHFDVCDIWPMRPPLPAKPYVLSVLAVSFIHPTNHLAGYTACLSSLSKDMAGSTAPYNKRLCGKSSTKVNNFLFFSLYFMHHSDECLIWLVWLYEYGPIGKRHMHMKYRQLSNQSGDIMRKIGKR